MTRDERLLRLLLRVIGAAALLAIPCALMPYAWMDAVHRCLGMGKLPEEPIVGYLARSISAFYGAMGGMLWLLSGDVRRYRPLLVYNGVATVLFGLFLIAVDRVEGLPWFWWAGEGTFNVVYGGVVLWLLHRLRTLEGKALGSG